MQNASNQEGQTVRRALLVWFGATCMAYAYVSALLLVTSMDASVDLVSLFIRGSYLWLPVIGVFLVAPVAAAYTLGGRALHRLAWAATVMAIAIPAHRAYLIHSYSQAQMEQGLHVEGWAVLVGFAPFAGFSILLGVSAHVLLERARAARTISNGRYAAESLAISAPLAAWIVLAVVR